MGCASSKLFKKELRQDIVFRHDDCTNHVVSLTSSTYGVLKLDKDHRPQPPIRQAAADQKKRSPPRAEPPEEINAWELMEGLEEEAPISVQWKKSPKSRFFLSGFADLDVKSPLKFFNQMASPKNLKGIGGKENRGPGPVNRSNGGVSRWSFSPKREFKGSKLPENSRKASPNLRMSAKGSENDTKSECSRTGSVGLSRRRSLGPLFDPELVESYEKELSEGEEQIKKMVFATPTSRRAKKTRECESILHLFEKNCPPGGENAVVIYTTTLRGIRKTFEGCNTVRSIVESHGVRMFERDVSMDSGFKEELRGLMGGRKEVVRVPLVFVKGRVIGGADEVVKLEEEGKLGILLDGIPMAGAACEGCAGIRFVMCMECSGSCKVLDEDGKKTVRCGECNENGLIQCPICC